MSFYRYALETKDQYIRSLTPLAKEIAGLGYYSYRYYTSHIDAPHQFHVASLGHESSWPNKSKTSAGQSNRFRIRYVIRGSAYFNGELVTAGQFFFNLPEEDYVFEVKEAPFEFYYVGVSGSGTDDIVKSAGFLDIPRIANCPFIHRIPEILDPPLLCDNLSRDPDYYLISVFMDLISLHRPYNEAEKNQTERSSYVYYCRALSYIREYLAEGITPHDIAAFLHLSPSYLRAIFAKHCKYSLREYLIRKRITHAAECLMESSCTVSEAAAAVGYEDPALFSKMFKRYMKVSPKEYRERKCAELQMKKELFSGDV